MEKILNNCFGIFLLLAVFSPQAFAQPSVEEKIRNSTPVSMIDRFKADQLFEEGKDLYIKDEKFAALKKFQSAVELNPRHPGAYEMIGEIFYIEEDWARAFGNYKGASVLNPYNAKIKNDLGVTAAKLGSYRAAVGYFEEALSLDSTYLDAKTNLKTAEELLKGQTILEEETFAKPGDPNSVVVKDMAAGNLPGFPYIYEIKDGKDGDGAKDAKNLKLDDSYIVSSTDMVTVKAVELDELYTFVTFQIYNRTGDELPIRLARPGKDSSWVIKDFSMRESYRLIQFMGQPALNSGKVKVLKKNQRLTLVAQFEPIEGKSLTRFHILEGDKPFPGGWNFYNLQLKPGKKSKRKRK